ncbi:GNAT family N-acetyltransferase [Bradyrhizobium sp. SZCCHNR1015]|uniref:GNAT family N-acetyltransferase n=1 Tax=Bradyrhizobium sp. SZCCHNR1015 TaxID=3057338 RepID=UPI002915D63B|nr:GNAT family N-acetyltransferase [Bradyrhizobium sp. SZCCHNR1015]
MPVSIRSAGPDDIGSVFALIRELADYEKLSHEVGASEADIAAALFCEHPTLFCDLAEWNGAVAGFAVWFVNFSTFAGKPGIYLEDLFVRPAFRRNGIGQALLGHLARTCIENGWARLQWSVLDWNAPSITFYKSLGAELMDEWTLCKVTGEALAQLAERAP